MLSLALVFALQGAPAPAPPPAPAVLELVKGRAVLISGPRSDPSAPIEMRVGQAEVVGGAGLLELAAGARANLRWKGRLSGSLVGPAFLEWEPSQELAVAPGSLSLRIQRLEALDLEVRSGRHTLHLPDDWRARVESTAFRLSQRAAGGFELKVHGGRPVAMEWRGDPTRARPPVLAIPGRTVHFHEPLPSPPDDQRAEHVWGAETWPWATSTVPQGTLEEREYLVALLDRHARGPRPWPAPAPGGWAGEDIPDAPLGFSGSDAPAPGGPSVDPSSLPPWLRSSMAPENGEPRAMPRAPRGSEGVQPPPVVTAKVDAPPVRGWLVAGEDPPVTLEYYRPADWRGVPRERLAWAGQLIVDSAVGVDVRRQSRGGIKVMVGARAPEEVWVFTPTSDVRLEPGAVAAFHADGRVITRIGSVEELDPSPLRPLRPAP